MSSFYFSDSHSKTKGFYVGETSDKKSIRYTMFFDNKEIFTGIIVEYRRPKK